LRIEYRDDDAPDIYTDDVCFDDSCRQMNVKATHKHPEHPAPSQEALIQKSSATFTTILTYSTTKNKNAVALGRRSGKSTSPKKQAAAQENGKKGGLVPKIHIDAA
jgi:hypothetical protein